jgi:hypothetical protein
MFSALSLSLTLAAVLAQAGAVPASLTPKMTAPEIITADAYAPGVAGAPATTITMQINQYSKQVDLDAVSTALKHGGYPGFLTALRKVPVVGTVTVAGQTVDIRWAREQFVSNARSIVLITDKPLFFVGGGRIDAKPRAGYEVAVMQCTLEDSGSGDKGSIAAAARVKPGGPTGVRIDDYSDKPIELKNIKRAAK